MVSVDTPPSPGSPRVNGAWHTRKEVCRLGPYRLPCMTCMTRVAVGTGLQSPLPGRDVVEHTLAPPLERTRSLLEVAAWRIGDVWRYTLSSPMGDQAHKKSSRQMQSADVPTRGR